MSASTWIARAKDRIDLHQPPEASSRAEWIGIDFSGEKNSHRTRKLLPLLVLTLVAALGISALRIDLIRIRYAMADVLEEEQELIAEQRKLIVRRRQLRDPAELAVQARARGFQPATQLLSLPDPIVAGFVAIDAVPNLPSVAAGPAADEMRVDWQ